MRIDTGIDNKGAQTVQEISTDEMGATALEYGFFVAFVGAALLVGAEILAGGVGGLYNVVNTVVSSNVDAAN